MVAVADLLADEGLRLCAVHLPHPEAAVRWVAASELTDPAPFLEGGELLLTTGLGTATWDAAGWEGYVARLLATGVAALGIGTGLTHPVPPPALVEAARRHGLNVLEVPRATTFVVVSRRTAALLEAEQAVASRAEVRVQRELTEAALDRDPTALPRRLADALRGAVCVLGRDGSPDHGPYGAARDLIDLADLRASVLRLRPHGMRAGSSRTLGAGRTAVHPLGLRGRPESYLAVLTPGRPTASQRSAVTTATALLSLAVENRLERRATERRMRGRALELLLGADARTARVVLAALHGTEPEQVSLPTRVQALRATGPADALDDALTALESAGSPARELSARAGDELWAVLPPAAASRSAEELTGAGLVVGVGSTVALEEAALSHEVAGHALREATPAAPLVRWDQLVGEGALALLDPGRAEAFGTAYLEPLRRDGGDEPVLRETLASFLRHNGSRGRVATELGVHRNTVRARVAQIEAALGRSLDEPQTRVNAWIALQAGRPAGVRR